MVKATPKKKVVKKAAVKKAVAKKAAPKKAAKKAVKTISYQVRYQKIAEAAYLLAEEQGFKSNSEMDNWLTAEAQIDKWIKAEKLKLID
jgi:hypothetical protein